MIEAALTALAFLILSAILVALCVLIRNVRVQTRKIIRAFEAAPQPVLNLKALEALLGKLDFRHRPVVGDKLNLLRDAMDQNNDSKAYHLERLVDAIRPTVLVTTNSRVVVCSVAIGSEYTKIVEPCLRSQEEFARQNGFGYVLLSEPPTYSARPPAWLKIALVSKLLRQEFEHVLFIDADAMVTNKAFDIQSIFRELDTSGKSIFLTEDEDGINAGVMFARNSAATKALLDLIWLFDSDVSNPTWEQFALKTLMDEYPEVRNAVLIEPNPKRFNSFAIERRLFHKTDSKNAWSSRDFICHFSGIRSPHLGDFIARYDRSLNGAVSTSNRADETTQNVLSAPAVSYLGKKPKVTFSRLGIHGQFGNQLFQIAACLGYAARFGAEPVLPEWLCSYSGTNYGNIFEGVKKYRGQLPDAALYEEKNFTYSDIPLMQSIDLRGNFQCERYFANAREQIRSIFAEPAFITKQLDEYIAENNLGTFNALHFRAYSHPVNDLNSPMSRLPESYYLSALQVLGDSTPLVIAADDKEFVASFLARHQIRRDVHILAFENPLLDFYALARARHIAISNSSFSWWAAYLSNAKRVSAPHRYFWFGEHERRNPFWDPRTLYPDHFEEIII